MTPPPPSTPVVYVKRIKVIKCEKVSDCVTNNWSDGHKKIRRLYNCLDKKNHFIYKKNIFHVKALKYLLFVSN